MLIFSHLIIFNPHRRGKPHYTDKKLRGEVQGLPEATVLEVKTGGQGISAVS